VDVRQRFLWVFLFSFVLATFIVVGTTVQDYLEIQMLRNGNVRYWHMVMWPAIWWYGWVPLVPFFFEFAWRHPISKDDWRTPILWLVAGGVAAFVIHLLFQIGAMSTPLYEGTHDSFAETVEYHILVSLYLNVFIYWCVVGSAHVARLYHLANQRAISSAELEAELASARLDSLKMQLHPHFLFNVLNGISTLIHRDVHTAESMLAKLSTLLRTALDRSSINEVTLAEEVEFLNEYLAIEQLRFGDSLQIQFDVEHGLEGAIVPSFLFQPLVENAIKHGLEGGSRGGLISISCRLAEDRLILEVSDDGVGLETTKDVMTSGVGLSNLQARLNRLYGDNQSIVLSANDSGGLLVTVSIPAGRSSPDSGI